MKVAIVGTGYVGLTTGACLAETGHEVVCADILDDKIAMLQDGRIPFYEPGLEQIVGQNLAEGRLLFTTDVAAAVRRSYVVFIAVGTPPNEDGSADLQHVLDAAGAIGRAMDGERIVVTKSTVPVGTVEQVRKAVEAETRHTVHVCSNPEFLREGAAVRDFMRPDRVVIGVDDPGAAKVLRDLYAPFAGPDREVVVMDSASAEITKYAANAMLATRISFMNAIAALCERVGADVDMVRRGVGTDRRIGPTHLSPGVGYGGSCFPKDVKALVRTMLEVGLDPGIVESVDDFNERQKAVLLDKAVARFGPVLDGLRFAVWGLAFKPDTDDMREASSLVTIRGLLERGAELVVHDPVATGEAKRILGRTVEYRSHDYDALEGADALVLHTEWQQYRRPNFGRMRRLMRTPVIFDGRNLYDPDRMRQRGFEYHSVGRPPVTPAEERPRTAREAGEEVAGQRAADAARGASSPEVAGRGAEGGGAQG